MTTAGWSTRDEVVFWLKAAGMLTLLGVIAVVRFALAVAFRVVYIALFLAGAVAVLVLVIQASSR